jgi:RNA polymerase-binding transcription factor DksA
MADPVDDANEIAAAELARSIAAARVPIPAGEPGECEDCGEEMPRLVNGRCGYCRDGRRRAA